MDIRLCPNNRLPKEWQPVFSSEIDFKRINFDAAMDNLVRNPNINSTVLMRADIYFEYAEGTIHYNDFKSRDLDQSWLVHNIEDLEPRLLNIPGWKLSSYFVRRNIPRNPTRDIITNQTCAFYADVSNQSRLLVYTPHLHSPEACPYYLPKAEGVALLYEPGKCSIHLKLWDSYSPLVTFPSTDRLLRISLRLLQTCVKHSRGQATGYRRRVNHDRVIDRVRFQNRYIKLKQKYSGNLIANWSEKTNPRKHVFEDLGIAAFLIELWSEVQEFQNKDEFEFFDLGCGNGLLVNILIEEGYHGCGIDARARKSWATYPKYVSDHLIRGLVGPHFLKDETSAPANVHWIGGSASKKIFLIGNHSDELTLWMPLLGYPFLVLPCCSHSLTGAKTRFPAHGEEKSAYAGLLEKTITLTSRAGWRPEVEWLRIPSTRNAAVIGIRRADTGENLTEIVGSEGGAEGWIHNMSKLENKNTDH